MKDVGRIITHVKASSDSLWLAEFVNTRSAGRQRSLLQLSNSWPACSADAHCMLPRGRRTSFCHLAVSRKRHRDPALLKYQL